MLCCPIEAGRSEPGWRRRAPDWTAATKSSYYEAAPEYTAVFLTHRGPGEEVCFGHPEAEYRVAAFLIRAPLLPWQVIAFLLVVGTLPKVEKIIPASIRQAYPTPHQASDKSFQNPIDSGSQGAERPNHERRGPSSKAGAALGSAL
jgi:hypothetical protein